ncbi:MAG: glycosyltransferase family 39 protein [Pirellulales bacterium]|nr:glycosyltransferase family 39 protein [Pirellulales bacterium]
MGFWKIIREPPAKSFPVRLTADVPPEGGDARWRARWWFWAGLLLIALLPRLLAAWQWNILWSDTVSYLAEAKALAAGDFQRAFAPRGLNVFPLILVWLQKTGWDICITGEWWSVAMGTLAILPLFGWIRRQFNVQVAMLAVILYAFHPKLVIFCPLIMRDPTFWFFFNLSIYLFWRAITESRWWLYLTAGLALTLCVHTRTEGWFLLPSFLLWSGIRVIASRATWARTVLGTGVCLAVIPVSIALVNLTWLRDCPHWGIIPSASSRQLAHWLGSFRPSVAEEAKPAKSPGQGVAGTSPASKASKRPPARPARADGSERFRPVDFRLVRKTGLRFVKAYTYAYGFLALVGLWIWRRVWIRPEHQALVLMGIILVVAVYVNFMPDDAVDIRYCLPLVLVSFPWMALGLLSIANGLMAVTGRRVVWNDSRRGVLVVALLAVVVALGTFDTRAVSGTFMHRQAALGKWIAEHYGAGETLAACVEDDRLLLYYSQGLKCHRILYPQFTKGWAVRVLKVDPPRVFVIDCGPELNDEDSTIRDFLREALKLGYRRVSADQLPPECGRMIVLVLGDDGSKNGTSLDGKRRCNGPKKSAAALIPSLFGEAAPGQVGQEAHPRAVARLERHEDSAMGQGLRVVESYSMFRDVFADDHDRVI